MKLILASSSPRRQEILQSRGYAFTIDPADIDEAFDRSAPVGEAMLKLARQKAEAVQKRHPGDVVIGADTMVFLEGEPLGKPADAQAAKEMLRRLSGRSHAVYSAVAVLSPGADNSFVIKTDVKFYDLPDGLISRYVATGEPLDKAGSYAIQGKGALLVESVSGDYLNIVGLPMGELAKRLDALGIKPLD